MCCILEYLVNLTVENVSDIVHYVKISKKGQTHKIILAYAGEAFDKAQCWFLMKAPVIWEWRGPS